MDSPGGNSVAPITNHPVRQALSAAIAAARMKGLNAAVAVLKVGDLTEINHWNGYEAGDHVIRSVMHRIDTCVPDGRLVGRLGGGHFLVLIGSLSDQGAASELVERLIASVSAPIDLPGGPILIHCTAGVSLMSDDSGEADQLLRNAELALRSASFGSYAFYRVELQASLASRVEIRSALVDAVEREEFFLVYQPQVCTETGRIFGVEALLRWKSHTLGLLSPDRFIPVAEDAGLMPQIGDWVLVSACRQASQWWQAGHPLRVAVNISAAQLETKGFAARVKSVLVNCQLPPSLLELEVTETMLVGSAENNRDTLRAIRRIGVKLALDDFGTGYSNLAYLRHFVFDTLKIDRLFTSAMIEGDGAGDILVRAIIAMGVELGHDIVAEGVETDEQKRALQQLGCSRMQGYLFGRPVPAGQLDHERLPVQLSAATS